jgi:hypothetical protein
VNGIASVLASVVGITVALNFGYRAASLVAGACYLFALAHAVVGRWSGPPAAPPAPPVDDVDDVDEDPVPELATT